MFASKEFDRKRDFIFRIHQAKTVDEDHPSKVTYHTTYPNFSLACRIALLFLLQPAGTMKHPLHNSG